VMIEADGRGGDLSPLGVRQHKGIAKRMIAAYPEAFTDKSDISARSTVVIRCVLSMDAFCEGLKEVNPNLDITRESSNRYMNYLNYHSPESQEYTAKEWKEEYRKFEAEHTNPERLISSIFSDTDFVRKNVNPHDFMWGMYWLASGMQDIETPLSFYDIFTPDELFDLWQCFNYRFYVCDGNYAGNRGLLVDNAKPLMRNVIESAEAAIASEEPTVTLRFGHDGNLIPYAALLQLDGCYASVDNPDDFYKVFSDFKIAPMAGNIQLIFFRNDEGDVLVKFLHNEVETSIPVKTDIWPFYHWSDVKRHLQQQAG
ncbi:MAG: histidine-type phosphatase, partial [Muribaculaceae bacterium]|nr:histidine-type phosphatase [Muribaculaceae bacterium]